MSLWPIPRGWAKRALGDVATVERAVAQPNEILAGTPYVGMEHMTSDGEFDRVASVDAGELASAKHRFDDRHVLYGRLRPYLRKVARPGTGMAGVCSTEILPILAGPQLDRDFLFHLLRRPDVVSLATARCSGANLPRVSASTLAELEVGVPPVREQRRIADVLDRADALRQQRRESLRLLGDLLRATFLEMFGDPAANARGWTKAPLGTIARVDRGRFTPRPRNDPRFYGGRFPFIQTGDIRGANGYLRNWTQTLNDEGVSVSRTFAAGTLATAIAANIGDTAIVTFDFCCPDSVVGIVPNTSVVAPEYLEMTMRFLQPRLIAMAPETAQKNINLEVLRPLEIPLAGKSQQEEFAQQYRRTYAVRQEQDASRAALDTLFNSLLQGAFTGAV